MIVFIENNPERIIPLRNALLRNLYHTACVTSNTVSHISRYPAHSVVIPHPGDICHLEDVCNEVRERFPQMTLASFYEDGKSDYFRDLSLFDTVIDIKSVPRAKIGKILQQIYSYNTAQNTARMNVLRIGTQRREPYLKYMLTPIECSATQWLMVRYLQMKHPDPVPAEELIETCFSHTRKLSVNNVRAQFHIINARFRELILRSPFVFTKGKGYGFAPWE